MDVRVKMVEQKIYNFGTVGSGRHVEHCLAILWATSEIYYDDSTSNNDSSNNNNINDDGLRLQRILRILQINIRLYGFIESLSISCTEKTLCKNPLCQKDETETREWD